MLLISLQVQALSCLLTNLVFGKLLNLKLILLIV